MRSIRCALAAGLCLTVAACGNDQPSSDAMQALTQLTKAANQMAEQAKGVAEGTTKPVPPVNYKTLIDYLPKGLDGTKAGEPKGETGSAGQWQYSSAKIEFSSDNGPRAEVGIFDYAYIPFLYAPYRLMLSMKVQRESTEGFERSTEVAGFPAFEQWDKNSRKSEVAVMVGERFVVTTEVREGAEGAAVALAKQINLKALSREK